MIVTPLKVVHLPEVYAQRLKYAKKEVVMEYYLSSIDYVGRLKGEIVSPGYNNVFQLRIEQENLPEMDARTVRIKCIDGDTFAYRRNLLRRFHFFDDYFDQFPEETSVSVPFTQKEVKYATYEKDVRLIDCYECLSFFNPKDSLHYFTFDTKGLDDSILIQLVDNLPIGARKSLLEARRMRYRGRIPPPLEGSGMGVISHVLEYYSDFDHLLSFFSECPSYLVFTVPSQRNILLRTADFSKEPVDLLGYEGDKMREYIMDAILDSNEKEHVRRLLAMIGLQHDLFGNKDYCVPGPYNVLAEYELPNHANTVLVNKLVQVFGITPEAIWAVLGL